MVIAERNNKIIVKKNFSRYADLYDQYADIQRLSADELIKKTPAGGIRDIIDIGCGTGNYTNLLRCKFKDAGIRALDISDDMIRVARKKYAAQAIEFVVADAEHIDLGGSYDLITSNATFQWFGDLGLSISKYRDALRPQGVIVFSTFGPSTFWELGRSLKEVLGPLVKISSCDFLTKETLTSMMDIHFRDVSIEESMVKKVYGSLEELLKHIKYTGTRGSGISGASGLDRATLCRIEEAYVSNFGAIEASHQIFYCGGSR